MSSSPYFTKLCLQPCQMPSQNRTTWSLFSVLLYVPRHQISVSISCCAFSFEVTGRNTITRTFLGNFSTYVRAFHVRFSHSQSILYILETTSPPRQQLDPPHFLAVFANHPRVPIKITEILYGTLRGISCISFSQDEVNLKRQKKVRM